MPTQDRTTEFRQCVSSIRSRSSSIPSRSSDTAAAKQRLLQPGGGKQREKSEFARLAGGIGRDISATSIKLSKLAQLAKRKTLFDDRPIEISELTFIIKQDIAHINRQIADLQSYVKAQKQKSASAHASSSHGAKASAKQVEEHNSNVVVLLQTKLASTSQMFADVLETRTQNMKASKDRTEQFMYTASSAATPPPPQNSVLFNPRPSTPSTTTIAGGGGDVKGKGRAQAGVGAGDVLALDMAAAEEGVGGGAGGGGGFMQMQLVEQQDTYIQSRSSAIESIESTMSELGQIFVQLSRMVAEQGETVQRIDADTTDIATNVGAAQRELLKYYASVSSNRWLMLKVFGVLIVFFLIFILVS